MALKPALETLRRFPAVTRTPSLTRPFAVEDPPQFWEDPTAEDSPKIVTYLRLPLPAEGSKPVPFQIKSSRARHANLPGRVTYPAYFARPLDGVRRGTVSVDDPLEFATLEDARRIMAETGGSNLRENNQTPGGEGVTYGPNEARRRYEFDVDGNTELAGVLFDMQTRPGVGAPGQWIHDGDAGLAWKVAPSVGDARTWFNALPEAPTPVRDLAEAETLVREGQSAVLFVKTADAVTDPGKPSQLPAHFEADFATLCHDVAAIRAALATAGLK